MAIAVQALRDEGVLDIGSIPGTCFVYVITHARMCMFHASELPQRRLDVYGAYRAVYWIERGTTSCRYAAKIGVSEPELRRALLSIGYARLNPVELAQRAGARAARKIGNRRGALVQIAEASTTSMADRAPQQARNPAFNDKSATSGLSKKRARFPPRVLSADSEQAPR